MGEASHALLVEYLRGVEGSIGRPAAIVLASAHWECPNPTITSGATPGLIYDYGGFPDETYRLRASYTVQYVDPTSPGTIPAAGFKSLIKVVILTVETREAIDSGYVRIIERRSIAVSDYV